LSCNKIKKQFETENYKKNDYKQNPINFKSQPLDNRLNEKEKTELFIQIKELSKDPNSYSTGSLGKVYKIKLPLRPPLAVKEFKEVYDGRNPKQEAESLKKIPKDSKLTQKFVDLIEKDGKQYLITTFQEGTSLHKQKDDMSFNLIRNILHELFKIERSGVTFYDYSMANIVTQNDVPKFFDFEVVKEQSLTKKNNDAYNDLCHMSRNIEFPHITNLAGFEIRTVGKIIGELEKYKDGETRSNEFVKKYLIAASEFYKYSTKMLIKNSYSPNSEISKDAIAYSYILSDIFANPTRDIINIEKQSMRIKELLTEYWYRNDPDLDHDDKLYANTPEYVKNLETRFKNVQKAIKQLKEAKDDIFTQKYCENTSKLLYMIENKELPYLKSLC
jgi:hypothetical protein